MDDDDSDASEKPRKKKRKTKEPAKEGKARPGIDPKQNQNPLLEYFKNTEPVSDDSSDSGPDFEPNYDVEDDESDAEPDTGKKLGAAPVNKFAAYRKAPTPPAGGTGETTEDDSDGEQLVVVAPKRKLPLQMPSDSEATEPDSESSEPAFAKSAPPKILKGKPAPDPDSDPDKTDPDSDCDQLSPPPGKVALKRSAHPPKELVPKPGFPVLPDQPLLGPLVLDAEQEIQVPAAINTYLRQYQREGIKFFWERYNEGRGGLLGDDMGLGKTIQVISFLSAIMGKNGVKTDRKRRRKHVAALQETKAWRKKKTLPPANETWPTCLIIAPSTVVRNWDREFKTWGYFEVGCYVGTPAERKTILKDFKLGRLDVVLTSIDLARRDIEELQDLAWTCVFVDEVHTVKNPKSKTSQAYNEFQCIRRFGLTGTAIQNSYDELWTILDWTSPGAVGLPGQWRSFVSNPLKIGQSAKATDSERARAVDVSEKLRDKLLPRFFLRRTKDIIRHQLPQKTDEVVFCPLTASQIRVYKRILAMEELQAMLRRDDPCPCGSKKTQGHCCTPFTFTVIFKFMSILIKLSNHLGLILPTPNDTREQLIRNRELAAIAFPDGNAPSFKLAILDPKYCGKWKVLLGLLEDWRKDRTNKVLIFTKSVKLLEMMAHQLKVASYGFLQLDGSTKQSERMGIIDTFHNDPDVFVFLISTMAGGTGLNLTGANKVVIFDPNWNPAHDLQAMDRAFRFGQTRDVSVFRLLGAGSVEELIYARQIYKQQQMQIGYTASIQTRYFSGVQGDKTRQGELFGVKNIFKLHESGLATKAAIEKAHVAELDWALGSLEAKPNGKRTDGDLEGKVDKEYSDLKGLEALLSDDSPQQNENSAKAAVRGMYTHQNPHLLVTSKFEEERTKNIVEKARKKPKKSKGGEESPGAAWPPSRVHEKYKKLNDQDKIQRRKKALLGLGMVKDVSELPAFMKSLQDYTEEQQAYIIGRLDEYRGDSDDDSEDDGVEIEPEPEDIDMDD
ncbi:RAD26-like SNF2 family DNA-dependent ATPase [Mycena albidolilacea]|uniref:RAD26-like SNF2 family DNA-dependent ATPase n=1 Tax=Mycena albidolilacea TaxID=1033008 RepID=A0AAD7EXX3_9AGAR|nr:RAD26-like SNF2 family DNA-dependent ATPase [Mycena albidolilacea]